MIHHFSGRTAKYTCAITRPTRPTPAKPCVTYVKPHVVSRNRYGLRTKNGVRTRTSMNRPVPITAKPVTGFKGRSGRSFRARLALQQSEDGKWRVEFDEPWAREGAKPPEGEEPAQAAEAPASAEAA